MSFPRHGRPRWTLPGTALLSLLTLLSVVPSPLTAQQIQLDGGRRLAELWLFPLDAAGPGAAPAGASSVWVYLPARVRLATDEQGQPIFSFLRYVSNDRATSTGGETLGQAAGGGVLHFAVELDTPAEQVQRAQAALREVLDDKKAELRGPLIFSDGQWALVSSVLNRPGAKSERLLLSQGRAPVLEGNRLALSFDLEPAQSTLLLESFKMATPDVSLVFDFTFAGLSQAYDAQLTIDWSEVRKSQSFKAGGTIYFVSADVETMFDELIRNNAIRLKTSGSDAVTEGLLQSVYSKLLSLLFERVDPDRVPADQQGGLGQALDVLLDPQSGLLSSRNTTQFGLYAGYQWKDLRSGGYSVLDFNHRARLERHSLLVFNIGDLWQRFGHDERFFRVVNLEDPTFQQREIAVAVDGSLVAELGEAINNVAVTLRKRHASGRETLREALIDAGVAKGMPPRLVYGWDQDQDRNAWLAYEVRTRWSFKGGGEFTTEWQKRDAAMINLFAPYTRRRVEIVGLPAELAAKKVRAVVVQAEHDFPTGRRRQQVVIRNGDTTPPTLELTMPLGVFEYDVQLTWLFEDGRRQVQTSRDTSGVIFIDEPPAVP